MELTHTSQRVMLAESVRAFVTRDWPLSEVRALQSDPTGFGPRGWKQVCDLGWTAMVVPEQDGGLGGGFLDLAVVAEELGRGAVSLPLVPTVAHGVLALLGTEAGGKHLPGLVAGTTIATPAQLEADGRSSWPTEAAPATSGGWSVSGVKVLVPFAEIADLIMVTARLDGLGEAVVALPRDRGGIRLRRQHLPVGDPVYRVELDAVEVDPSDVVAGGSLARQRWGRCAEVSTVLSSAYTVGLCESALRLAVDHAKNREQFGRPIGAFQAVANRCVDMKVEIDAFRLLTYEAAWLLDRGGDASLAVASSKVYGDLTVRTTITHSHQVLAAMGVSTEHDLYLFTRRARTYEQTGGSHTAHLHRVADRIGL